MIAPWWVNTGKPTRGRHSETLPLQLPIVANRHMTTGADLDAQMIIFCRENLAKHAIEKLGLRLTDKEKKDADLEWVLSYLGASVKYFFEDFKSEYDLDAFIFDLGVMERALAQAKMIASRSHLGGKFVSFDPKVITPNPATKPEVILLKNKGETISE